MMKLMKKQNNIPQVHMNENFRAHRHRFHEAGPFARRVDGMMNKRIIVGLKC